MLTPPPNPSVTRFSLTFFKNASQISSVSNISNSASQPPKLRFDVPTPESKEKFQRLKRKESDLLQPPALTEIMDFWERQVNP